MSLSDQVRATASQLGFDLVGVAPAVTPPGFHPLLKWISDGYAADMDWMERRSEAYRHPDGVLKNCRSVIVTGMNYHNQRNDVPSVGPLGRIARYAQGGTDYHLELRSRLQQLASVLHQSEPAAKSRVVVDTAPLLERDFARMAGIGWFGKNTMLINRSLGSWFFLGAVLTTVPLEYSVPYEEDFCGTCTACLDACPTQAFPEPHVLDSNRCISYLTIERRDKPVPHELREGIQDWVFGCDICQEVCPWNRFAPRQSPDAFHPVEHLSDPDCTWLLQLSDQAFAETFKDTPLERTGRAAVLRNAVIALGNQKDPAAVPALETALGDHEPLIRGAAAWALAETCSDRVISILQRQQRAETDENVLQEIAAALAKSRKC